MIPMPITGGQWLVKPLSKRKKLFYLCYIVKIYLNLYFSKTSCGINYQIFHWGILPKWSALLLRSVSWDYPALAFMSSILLPLFHALRTLSTKIPVPLPSPQLFLPSLPEGRSFLALVPTPTYTFPGWVPTASCPFCARRLLRALKQAPSLLRMKQSNLATAGPVQEQIHSHHLHSKTDEVNIHLLSRQVQWDYWLKKPWLLLIHILKC